MPEPRTWEGVTPRECGDHRTTGGRAWCFDCSEWCSEVGPCRGCELPSLRARLAEAEAPWVMRAESIWWLLHGNVRLARLFWRTAGR